MSLLFDAGRAAALRRLGDLFWLDSAGGPPGVARRSFLGAGPVERLDFSSAGLRSWRPATGWEDLSGDPFDALASFWERARTRARPGPVPRPLCVGYLSYDLGAWALGLSLPQRAAPALSFAAYDAAYVLDHQAHTLSLLGDEPSCARLAAAWDAGGAPGPARASFLGLDTSEEDYRAMLARAREHLLDGDIYQANLSLGLRASLDGDPLGLYARLRHHARAPFCAYLEGAEGAILSASMERFLSARPDGDAWEVETRPIKGTRPRGAAPAEDEALRAALLASEKDAAEHVMIVDLERNDLGRVAQTGSVRVEALRQAIPYETVHHLESSVRGRVPRAVGLAGLLRATFPTGSITGAPKRRAMEIIASLEGGPRGVYCGAIGYLDDHGGFDFSVAIRTAEARAGQLSYRAGGGIVIDSDPAAEWRECSWKAEAFLRALRG